MQEKKIWQDLKDMYLSYLDKEYQINPSVLIEGLRYSVKSMEYLDYRSIDKLIKSIDMYLTNEEKVNKDYRTYLSLISKDNLLVNYEEKLKILMATIKDKYYDYLKNVKITSDIHSSLVNIYNELIHLNKKELTPIIDSLKVTINTYEDKLSSLYERQSTVRKLSQLTLTKLNTRYKMLNDKVNNMAKQNIDTSPYQELLKLYSLEIRRRKNTPLNVFPYSEYEKLKEEYSTIKIFNEASDLADKLNINTKNINITSTNELEKVTKISNKLTDNDVFSPKVNNLRNDLNENIVSVSINGLPLILESKVIKNER